MGLQKSRPFFRSPLGLVLAGGGAHGSWQAGCLEALVAGGLAFDRVLGVSVGSLIGAAYALGQVDELAALWRDIDRRRLLRLQPRLKPPSVFSSEPVWEAIRYAHDDERARRAARCELIVVSLRVDDGEHHYARFAPGGAGAWDGPLAARLLASCAVPLMFPPVRIAESGLSRSYVDGGAPGRGPASFAAMAGCRDVLLLQMVRPDEVGRVKWWVQLLGDQLGRDLEHGLRTLLELPAPPRVFRIYPSEPLSFSPFAFRSLSCGPALERGRRDGQRFLEGPQAYLEGVPGS